MPEGVPDQAVTAGGRTLEEATLTPLISRFPLRNTLTRKLVPADRVLVFICAIAIDPRQENDCEST